VRERLNRLRPRADDPPERVRRRRRAATILGSLAAVGLLLSLLLGYAWRAVFDSDQFANRAAHALESDPVRTLAAEKLTDEVILRAAPDVIAARPLIESAASSIVGGNAFTSLFRSGVRDVHRSVFSGERDTVTLTVANAAVVLEAALRALDPKLAPRLPDPKRVELVEAEIGTVTGDLTRTAHSLRLAAFVLAGLTLALLAVAVATSPDRRRLAVQTGVAVAGAAVLLLVAYGVGRALALRQLDDPDARAAAGAVWNAYLLDLRNATLVLAGAGAVTAAAAASLIRPVAVEEPIVRAWRAVMIEPDSTVLRWLRTVLLVATGLLVLFEREVLLQLALTLAGVYLLYKGLESGLRLVARGPEQRPAPGGAPAGPVESPSPRPHGGRRRIAVAVVAGLLIVAGVASFVGSGGASAPDPELRACNGHAELCDRPFDQVVLPATHNSMSAPLPGWFSSQQDRPIDRQLEDGVRGFLIDTHYGVKLENGRVKTDLEDAQNVARQQYADELGPKAVDSALEIRDKLGFAGGGEREIFLCHTFCELGATKFASVLEDLRDFLSNNPHEVVVVVNQDAVEPADVVRAFDDAGLTEFVYRGGVAGPWPTLEEMIERNERLVVLAEERAGTAPWYQLAYGEAVQETPFSFSKAADLTERSRVDETCKPNRGPRSAPLMLINHWVSTDPAPLPSNAKKVNARDPLLRRAKRCEEVRGRVPNLVAVDFYRQGELVRVVDELNEHGGAD